MPVARTVFVPALPGGRVFACIEERNEVVLAFVTGHVSPQAAEEMTAVAQAVLDADRWIQNWAGPDGNPDPQAN
jgi:hypothetical protein